MHEILQVVDDCGGQPAAAGACVGAQRVEGLRRDFSWLPRLAKVSRCLKRQSSTANALSLGRKRRQARMAPEKSALSYCRKISSGRRRLPFRRRAATLAARQREASAASLAERNSRTETPGLEPAPELELELEPEPGLPLGSRKAVGSSTAEGSRTADRETPLRKL